MNFLSGSEILCPLSVLDRVGIMEVFKRKYMRILSGHWKLSVIDRSPYYRGVRTERIDCILFYP